jgi:RimJ/RimL family protein N-acetyltransferase
MNLEGTMREYLYHDGRPSDENIFALYRDGFDEWKARRRHGGEHAGEKVDIHGDDCPDPSEAIDVDRPTSNRLTLEPVSPIHVEFLYSLTTQGNNAIRWRYGGVVPSRDEFMSNLWNGVLCQFVVSTARSRRPIGMVVAYGADLIMRRAFIGGVGLERVQRTGLMNEAFALLIQHLRRTYRIERVYLEFPEFNLSQFASGFKDHIREEARLRDHTFFNGEFWDYLTYSLSTDPRPRTRRAGVPRE